MIRGRRKANTPKIEQEIVRIKSLVEGGAGFIQKPRPPWSGAPPAPFPWTVDVALGRWHYFFVDRSYEDAITSLRELKAQYEQGYLNTTTGMPKDRHFEALRITDSSQTKYMIWKRSVVIYTP